MKQPKVQAVLEFHANQDPWKLTEPYAEIVKKHCDMPAILQLPWSIDAIPAVGSNFESGDLPSELQGVVESVGYVYYRDRNAITIEIAIQGRYGIDWRGVDDGYLICLAEAGMILFPSLPISKALRDAGLPATTAAWRRSQGKKQLPPKRKSTN